MTHAYEQYSWHPFIYLQYINYTYGYPFYISMIYVLYPSRYARCSWPHPVPYLVWSSYIPMNIVHNTHIRTKLDFWKVDDKDLSQKNLTTTNFGSWSFHEHCSYVMNYGSSYAWRVLTMWFLVWASFTDTIKHMLGTMPSTFELYK